MIATPTRLDPQPQTHRRCEHAKEMSASAALRAARPMTHPDGCAGAKRHQVTGRDNQPSDPLWIMRTPLAEDVGAVFP
jgi:hypothetical protein